MKIAPNVRGRLESLARVAVTVSLLAVAIVAGRLLWNHYQLEPTTRDGRIRADIVQIAPDVSGIVTQVDLVNDQVVRKGQPLFYIDRDRYVLALRQAQARLRAQQAILAQARREDARNRGLGILVAAEVTEQSDARVAQAEAALAEAMAARDAARLNLDRTVVVAPTDGTLSDLALRVGDYVTACKPVLALIDSASFRVEGYFEETKLQRIRIGQPVTVRVMGEATVLTGHVQSMAAAIEDRDRAASSNMLPNVNPTFSWVRLAQRVPVRVSLDAVPGGVRLIAGRTASVSVVEAAPAGTRTL